MTTATFNPNVTVLRTDEVPLALVDISPYQPRKQRDMLVIGALSDSLAAVGMLHRPRVRERGERYELVFGHQRAEAARALGWESIPVEVVACDDLTARRMTLHENIKSTRLHPVEQADAIVQFVDATLGMDEAHAQLPGETPAERVAQILGMLVNPPAPGVPPSPARAWISDREGLIRQILREMAGKEPKSFLATELSLLQLPEAVLAATLEHGLGKGQAKALGQLLEREPALFEEVLERGVRKDRKPAEEESWMPLESAPVSAIKRLYSPPNQKEFKEQPRELAAERPYIPVGLPSSRRDEGGDDEMPPWEDDGPVGTPSLLSIATLAEAYQSLVALRPREWAAVISEADFAEGREARARWAELGQLAVAIERELSR